MGLLFVILKKPTITMRTEREIKNVIKVESTCESG